MIPAFNHGAEIESAHQNNRDTISPPHPQSAVRHTLTPPGPAPMLCAATDWRRTVRPPPPHRPRATAIAATVALALLAVWVLTTPAATPDATRVATSRSAPQ